MCYASGRSIVKHLNKKLMMFGYETYGILILYLFVLSNADIWPFLSFFFSIAQPPNWLENANKRPIVHDEIYKTFQRRKSTVCVL